MTVYAFRVYLFIFEGEKKFFLITSGFIGFVLSVHSEKTYLFQINPQSILNAVKKICLLCFSFGYSNDIIFNAQYFSKITTIYLNIYFL